MENGPKDFKYALSGRMEIHPCVLQDIGPLGPLPCSHSTSSANHSKQGIGYRWPCAILGWLVRLHCLFTPLQALHWGSNSNIEAQIQASRLKSMHRGSNPSLVAQIQASWLKLQAHGSNHDLEAQITAQRLKSHYLCSTSSLALQNLLSIGHRLLRGRCPSHHHTPTYTHIGATGTADHLTLLRLLILGIPLSGILYSSIKTDE